MSDERRSVVAIALLGGTFALLAALVAGGTLDGLDQYAVDHWMPHVRPGGASPGIGDVLVPKLGSPLQTFCNLWTYPASALVSSVLLLVLCGVLVRRGRRAAAWAWVGGWALANAVEVIGKHLLERPSLHEGGRALHNFDNSFPSGHTVRAIVLASIVVAVWPRTAPLAIAWVLVALPALVVSAAHTPTDIVGGVVLAAIVLLGMRVSLQLVPARAPRRHLRAAIADEP